MASELCETTAHEAVRRGARVNVHEMRAALEAVDDVRPVLVVDVGSEHAMQWAWWSLGAQVIGVQWAVERVQPAFSSTQLPESVTVLVADPRERDTVQRVTDQVAGRPVDVLVLGFLATEENARIGFHAYAPMVRPGGLVLVRGIADPRVPGVRQFWCALDPCGREDLVADTDPIGFGVMRIHGKDRTTHG
jgi:hypothetical protein